MNSFPLQIKIMGVQFIQKLRHSCYYLYEVNVAPNVKHYKIISSKLDSTPYRLVITQQEADTIQKIEDSKAHNWYASSFDSAFKKFMEITKNRK